MILPLFLELAQLVVIFCTCSREPLLEPPCGLVLAQYVGNVDGELRHDVGRDKGRGYRIEHRPTEPLAGPRLRSDHISG